MSERSKRQELPADLLAPAPDIEWLESQAAANDVGPQSERRRDSFALVKRDPSQAPRIRLGEEVAGALPEVGEVVAGRYLLRERLGEGHNGVVYAAQEQGTPLYVAVQFVPSDGARPLESLARLKRDAKLGGRIRHKNLIQIHGLFAHGEGTCIVMDLLRGGTLDLLLEQGPLPEQRFMPIILATCDGVQALHQAHLVHGALQPLHLFVSSMGRKTARRGLFIAASVKVMDRSLLQLIGASPHGSGSHAGGYRSPEQLEGKVRLDARSDVFSLGAITFHALCGVRAEQMRSDQLRSGLEELAPQVDPRIARVVQRALSPDKQERFVSAGAFRDALCSAMTSTF